MARRPTPTQRKLKIALTRSAAIDKENAALRETLALSRRICAEHERRLGQAVGLIRSAADQFRARQIGGTADHLYAEALRLDPAPKTLGDAAQAVEVNEFVEGLRQARGPKER